jgi:poly-gamma-glutamate synthesis protein (capsule biosynthesis protein)
VRGRTIAFVGFNSVSNPLNFEEASTTLATARQAANLVIAYVHWGVEYHDRPTRDQENEARWLIDHGVDVVIGAHPHWTQGVSLYKGKPILYSLGNFVFDQDWSRETGQGLVARFLISERDLTIDFYPIQIDKAQPHFLDGKERQARLQSLAAISDASLAHQIMQGAVTLPFSQ